MDILDIGASRSFTKKSLAGMGAIKGAPCTVSNVQVGENETILTLLWTGNDGSSQTRDVVIPHGVDGKDGLEGKSAYQIALEYGFEGTEEEWLESLKGETGSGADVDVDVDVDIVTIIDKNSTDEQVPSAKAIYDNYALKSTIDGLHTYGTNIWKQSGWYRIAEYSARTLSQLKGGTGNGCLLSVKGEYQKNRNSDYLIKFSSAYNRQRFDLISAVTYLEDNVVTKIRYTYNEAEMKGYIEVYYAVDTVNAIYTEIINVADRLDSWKGVTPYQTEETVEGVTVVTTFDIPANAIPATNLDIEELASKIDEIDKTTNKISETIQVKGGVNIFDEKSMVETGLYWYTRDAKVGDIATRISNQYTSDYGSLDIPVDESNSKLIVTTTTSSKLRCNYRYFTDDEYKIITFDNDSSGIYVDSNGVVFDIPKGAKHFLFNINNYVSMIQKPGYKVMVAYGDEVKPYDEYEVPSCYIKDLKTESIDELNAKVENIVFARPKIDLPNKYSLVVGDTFELFYRGILNVSDYSNLFIEPICGIGKAFTKRFIVTPTSSDIGTHKLTVNVYDSDRNLLATSETTLVIKDKATSPTSEKVLLYVGDSLAVDGCVPREFNRRLTADSGNPIGDNLSNISFIGTCESKGVNYEGHGGYSFNSYNTENVKSYFMWITCNHDKTEVDQHSVYKDSNGKQWKLETLEEGRIKIIGSDTSATLPSASGTLTWYSGGENNSDIVYTASEQASGNPFWDSTNGKVDFAKYVSKFGKNSLDYVYVLLGWNSAYQVSVDIGVYKEMVLTFISNVHESFPNCNIVLLGLQVPARDGLGNNYGANKELYGFYVQMNHVFKLNKLYSEIAEENSNVSFVNIAGQFDTEHNHYTATRQVNVRNSEMETYQINGVHPAQSGSYQIADACYRDFIHKLLE